MNGVLACLTAIAGFILGVRVGFALARRNDAKRARTAAKK
jgi:hypothetical protein